ncbi:MAG: MFS transporter [Clostridia bacterium]|nr:MFS transporter [Clostridia bacterium]
MFPKGKRIPLFLVLVALFWFSLYSYQSIFRMYIADFSSTQMAGTIIASYGFVQMCLRIPIGILSDKIKSRKLFVTIGLVASGVSALGLVLFPNPTCALIFRGLAGLTAATWVPFSILYSSYYDKAAATKAIGIANSFNFGGQMVATLLGGFLPDWTGSYAGSFYLAVAVAAAGVVISFFIKDQEKESFPEKPVKIVELLRVAKDPMLLIASTLAILTQFCSFATVYGFTPDFATANAAATSSQLGIMTTLVTLPAIFAAPMSSNIAKKLGGFDRSMLIVFIVSAAYTCLVPFIHNIYLFYIAQFIFGFVRGCATSMMMGVAILNIDPSKRATAMGFFQAIYGIGMTLGPQVVGWFGKSAAGEVNLQGLMIGFFFVAATQLVGAVLSMTVLKKQVSKHPLD